MNLDRRSLLISTSLKRKSIQIDFTLITEGGGSKWYSVESIYAIQQILYILLLCFEKLCLFS